MQSLLESKRGRTKGKIRGPRGGSDRTAAFFLTGAKSSAVASFWYAKLMVGGGKQMNAQMQGKKNHAIEIVTGPGTGSSRGKILAEDQILLLKQPRIRKRY